MAEVILILCLHPCLELLLFCFRWLFPVGLYVNCLEAKKIEWDGNSERTLWHAAGDCLPGRHWRSLSLTSILWLCSGLWHIHLFLYTMYHICHKWHIVIFASMYSGTIFQFNPSENVKTNCQSVCWSQNVLFGAPEKSFPSTSLFALLISWWT